MWKWGIGFLRNCTAARFRKNTLANLKLGHYSLDALHEITADVAIDYDRGARGVLKIYRDREALDTAIRACELFSRHGLTLSRAHARGKRRVRAGACGDQGKPGWHVAFPER